ncbi:MAG TPA: MerR family transcriptional regulator [Terriglobales bacterium]|nr:MerR family transcriptional regulator [Terriglobales bacterium]
MSPARKSGPKKKSEDIEIPDKLYFRIGEVGRLCHLPPYVLRFWETEFPQLKPAKGSTGQRMYRRRDVEFVVRIRKLLYEDGYTIAGARHLLKAETRPTKSQSALPFHNAVKKDGLKRVRQQLQEILSLLSVKGKGSRAAAGRHG